jgi:hypothetical protein
LFMVIGIMDVYVGKKKSGMGFAIPTSIIIISWFIMIQFMFSFIEHLMLIFILVFVVAPACYLLYNVIRLNRNKSDIEVE